MSKITFLQYKNNIGSFLKLLDLVQINLFHLCLQLRPSATVYELARNFNLEVSMFERLVKVGFPYVRLNYQVS